jgi:hypothetical protein
MTGSRSRIRSGNASPGSYRLSHVGGTSPGSNGANFYEQCDDMTMSPPFNADHPLTITRYKVSPGRISGTTDWDNNGNKIIFSGYNPEELTVWSNMGASPPAPNWDFLQTKAIANANPRKPAVDVPLFLWEFREFPSMLRHAGRVLSRKARADDLPGSYLAFHFGWRPLVSDLMTLFNLAEESRKRASYLRKLIDGKRSAKIGLGTTSSIFSTNVGTAVFMPFVGNPFTEFAVRYTRQLEDKTRNWATIKARLLPGSSLSFPSSPPSMMSDDLVLGLHLRPHRFWDFVPWTWLIDYFINYGDFLEALDTTSVLSFESMCLMSSFERVARITSVNARPGLSLAGFDGSYTIKRRKVVSIVAPLYARAPTLSGGQLGALGSLITAAAFKKAAAGG